MRAAGERLASGREVGRVVRCGAGGRAAGSRQQAHGGCHHLSQVDPPQRIIHSGSFTGGLVGESHGAASANNVWRRALIRTWVESWRVGRARGR